jgi:hypothetical protein
VLNLSAPRLTTPPQYRLAQLRQPLLCDKHRASYATGTRLTTADIRTLH